MSKKVTATKEMCVYCFDTILQKFNSKNVKKLTKVPKEWAKIKCPLFVTLKKYKNDALRGCIGTFASYKLDEGLSSFALKSSFSDHRFSSLKEGEVKELHVGVSLLVEFEKCSNIYDWEVGKHGIRISFPHPENSFKCGATYLPEVASDYKWTKKETFNHLCRKAGLFNKKFEDLEDYFKEKMSVERYQSSKIGMKYPDYLKYGEESDV